MKVVRYRRLACALVALALEAPRPALADGAARDAARAAFNEAASLAAQKRWSAACERYARSLALHRSALTLYSLGVAQREAGRLVAARASFEAFLAEPKAPATQAYTGPARSALAELRARIGGLVIVLEPAPVLSPTLTIDGVPVIPGPLSKRHPVDPGAHDIVARAPGRAEARAHLTVPEGGSITVTLTLTPLPSSGVPVEAEVDFRPPGPAARVGPGSGGEPWPRALPFALLGTGGAVVVGGAALGLAGFIDAQQAPSSRRAAAGDGEAAQIAGGVLIGTGVAAAGVGLVLLLVQPTHPVGTTARPWIRPGPGGVSVSF